jgi:hypothetical protein
VNLFGLGVQSKSPTATSQKRINLYAEFQAEQDKTRMVLYGTPGLTQFINFGDTPVRGCRAIPSKNLTFFVHRGTLWEVNNSGVKTSRGTLNTSSGYVSISDNGLQLCLVDGTNGYTFTFSGNSFAQIASGNFPNGATTVTFLDGFFLVNVPNSGKFQKSAAYDGTTWAALDVATAEASPDNLVRVYSRFGEAILFGTATTEFWGNTGSAGFPFARVGSTTQQWGLAAVEGVDDIVGTVAFLAQNNSGEVQVMLLNGYNPIRISNSEVENAINSYSSVSDAIFFSYMLDGHQMLQCNFPTGNATWLYDATSSNEIGIPVWSQLQSSGGRHLANRHVWNQSANVTLVTDYSTGQVYYLQKNTYSDNGAAIVRTVQMRHIFHRGDNVTLGDIWVDMETGVGLATGQGSSPMAMMSLSKDGGHTFGNERWASIGAIGNYKTRLRWRRWGKMKDGVFKLSISDPIKVVLTDAVPL